MLHNLHVQRFKSLRDVTLELAPLVVVFGPNAAGKSNLLEAVVLLSRLVRERTIAEAFHSGIRGYPLEAFSFDEGGVEGLLKRAQASLRLQARLGPPGETQVEYEVEVAIQPQSGELSLSDERLQKLTARGTPQGMASIARVDIDAKPKLHIRRKGKGNHPYEEKPGINHTLVSNRQYAGSERFPDFDMLRGEAGAWRVVYLDPREAMRRAQPPREVEDIGERGEYLVPFLHRLATNECHKGAFNAIVRSTRAVIPSIENVRTDLISGRGEIDLWIQQDGVWLPARVVSEGTLRVLALCSMAANPFSRGLVAFEEPENGVHPRRIEVVSRILASAARERQVVVTTHSPLVVGQIVQMIRRGDLDAAKVRLVRCAAGPDGSKMRTFDPLGPLFDDQQLRQALVAAEDAAVVGAALERGWLDG